MITPLEIRHQSFNREFRGYDRVEVDAFLDELSKVLEKQIELNRGLREKLEKTQASYNTLKEVETMLHKTLIQAEQSSKTMLENARQKAELKVREAEARARQIVQDGIEARNQTDKDIHDLTSRRDEILMQMQIFLKSQLERLDSIKHLPGKNGQASKQLHTHTNGEKAVFELSENGHVNGHVNGSSNPNIIDDILKDL